MDILTLILIKKEKRKRYLLFCDKASQKNTKKEKLYTYKYSYKYTSPYYILTYYNLPICMSENQIMRGTTNVFPE